MVGQIAGDHGFKKSAPEELARPDKLKPGFYFLIASHDRTFTDRDTRSHSLIMGE